MFSDRGFRQNNCCAPVEIANHIQLQVDRAQRMLSCLHRWWAGQRLHRAPPLSMFSGLTVSPDTLKPPHTASTASCKWFSRAAAC